MTCARCGTANVEGTKFCGNCGNQLVAVQMPGTYQSAAKGAIVGMNLALVGLVGLGLGFVGGVLIAAYVLFPMGGIWSLAGIFAPIVGMVVGYRLLMEGLAR